MREDIFKEAVEYKDGALYWTKSVRFGINAGDRAGGVRQNGYRYVRYQNVQAAEHRIVWMLHHGEIPSHLVVDHINRDRADNRIENLRLLTNRENTSNWIRRPFPVGVQRRASGKFRAQAKSNGRNCYIGTFDTVEEAAKARESFLETAGTSPNRV